MRKYTDYDYLNKEEAEYQGYDTDDDKTFEGYSIINSDQEDEEDDLSYDEDDDQEKAEERENDENQENSEDQENDEDRGDDEDEPVHYSDSGEEKDKDLWILDGREFKELRQYLQAIYKKEVSQYPQLDREEQIALERIVRKGMLCECYVRLNDPDASKKYQYELVDKPSKVLPRLHQTEEEKGWVDELSVEQLHQFITEGRAAQEKMVCSNLPLVMELAGKEHNQMEYMDRVEVGSIGLIKAVQYFNPNKGKKFSTFAAYLILNEMRDEAKKQRKQRGGTKIWENYVPTEAVINAVINRMGGEYWMREMIIETEMTEEEIRRLVSVLLQRKVYLESVANDRLFGYSTAYEEVLETAENVTEEDIKKGKVINKIKVPREVEKTAGTEEPDSDYSGSNPRFDIIKGDGKPPRDDELSFEDYVRSFFGMIVELKAITPEKLAMFVLRNTKDIRNKAGKLRRVVDREWRYTEESAIGDLEELIGTGAIWPERPLIKQIKKWENIDSEGQDKQEADDLSDYINMNFPTESIAMILMDDYVNLRQEDLWIDAKISLDYYGRLCEIIELVGGERLNERDGKILEGLAEGKKYSEIQQEQHVSPNTVKRSKDEIHRSLYDQIVENTNWKYGDVVMNRLIQKYQAWVIRDWEKKIINRMYNDHFIEKRRFALRSRGTADSPRPVLEMYYKIIAASANIVHKTAEGGKMIDEIYGDLMPAVEAVEAVAQAFKEKTEAARPSIDVVAQRMREQSEALVPAIDAMAHAIEVSSEAVRPAIDAVSQFMQKQSEVLAPTVEAIAQFFRSHSFAEIDESWGMELEDNSIVDEKIDEVVTMSKPV